MEKCEWSQDDEDSGKWDTSCRNSFWIDNGIPSENHMKFCCYCGKPLVERPYQEEAEEDEIECGCAFAAAHGGEKRKRHAPLRYRIVNYGVKS